MLNKKTKVCSRTLNGWIHEERNSRKARRLSSSSSSDSSENEKSLEVKRQTNVVMKKDMEIIKNLVYLYFLMNPGAKPRSIFMKWYNHSVLADYTRPELSRLRRWIAEFQQEIYGN